jgi:UPF0755 protein
MPARRALIVAVLSLAAVVLLAFAYQSGMRPVGGDAVYVKIEPGSTWGDTIDELKQQGAIRSAFWANLYVRIGGVGRKPAQPGVYRMSRSWSTRGVLARIASRETVHQSVTIPEGRNIRWMADLLEKKEVCPAEEFVNLAGSPREFADAISFRLPDRSLEGYLFPDTYDMPPRYGARAAIRTMLRNFERRAREGGLLDELDLADLVIIASMIELEAKVPRDRELISGVIQNRLAIGMRLQIDATVLYGLGKWKSPVTREDLRHPSPYNTYLHAGLPPTPICNPGLASLKAAAHPAEHDYLYYVVQPDGSHRFSSTYAEHLRNKRRAQQE